MLTNNSSKRSVLFSLIASFGVAGCSVFGISNVEEAAHTVLKSDGNYELRKYAPVVVATTEVEADFQEAGGIAFRRLFGYISGNNATKDKIAMTAPVLSDKNDGITSEKIQMTAPVIEEKTTKGWVYSFVLPSSYSIDSAPEPLLETVKLAVLSEKQVAVLRYSGTQKEPKMQRKLRELNNWIESNNLDPVSGPRWAGYNPPFTIPFFRRNEVMIDVE